MTLERLVRFSGLILGGLTGWEIAFLIPGVPAQWTTVAFLRWGVPLSVVGAVVGYAIMPFLVLRPLRAATAWIRTLPLAQLVAGSLGLMLGLLIAAVLAIPLSRLPSPFGQILPLLGTLVFGYLGTIAAVYRYPDLLELWHNRQRLGRWGEMPVLVDTSAIIDGRLADVVRTGFLRGPLLVPRFVLTELQHVADSEDPLRRNRGRRGLEILRELQEESKCEVRLLDEDARDAREVDEKLLFLARRLECPILTNDYNLNRIATLQGIEVLNINDLANAVKTVLLPGESIDIDIIQEGKEPGQGVGYLEDGTMVVVQEGRPYIGRKIRVTVTKVLQTSAGRMIFAVPAASGQK